MRMKRLFCLILALCMPAVSGAALAAEEHYAVRIVFSASGREIPVDIDLYTGEGQAVVTSSLLKDTGILVPIGDIEEIAPTAEQLKNLADDGTVQAILDCAQEWALYIQPETKTGVFSGNAFPEAREMQRYRFSYGDLTMLIRRIRAQLPPGNVLRDLIDATGIDWLFPLRNIQFDLKLFDGGKYASLDVLNGEDTLMTCSADLEDPASLLIVSGVGLEGKNYYSRIITDMPAANRLIITEKLYADDLKTGFAGLDDNALILSTIHEIEWNGTDGAPEEIGYTLIVTPANGMTPLSLTAKITPSAESRVAEGVVQFSGYDKCSAKITIDRSEEKIGEMPGNLTDLSRASEEETAAFGAKVQEALTPVMLQVVTAMPEEYLMIVMNTVHP